MIDKIKSLSQIIVIPSAILYFLGFICYSVYIAQFGFVNFEVLNARFIAAGFFPAICFSVTILFAWHLRKSVHTIKPFNSFGLWKARLKLYLTFLPFVFIISSILAAVFNYARYRARTKGELVFTPVFGEEDWLADFFSAASHTNASLEFMVRASLYLFAYAFPMALVFALLVFIGGRLRHPTRAKTSAQTEASTYIGRFLVKARPGRVAGILFIDALAASVYVAGIWFAFKTLHANIFDFDSLPQDYTLSSDILFSWTYATILAVFACISYLGTGRISGELFDELIKPINAQYALQQVLAPLFFSLILFGIVVFPRIPFAIGGGEPREISVVMSSPDRSLESLKLFLIGESSQFFYVIADGPENRRALQIKKESVTFLEIKQNRAE